MAMSRKAFNFDISQEKLTEHYAKENSYAYYEIKVFFEKNGFEHRQGSGYVSKKTMTDTDVIDLCKKLSKALPWLAKCVKQFDATNVGKTHSLNFALSEALEEMTAKQQDDSLLKK